MLSNVESIRVFITAAILGWSIFENEQSISHAESSRFYSEKIYFESMEGGEGRRDI